MRFLRRLRDGHAPAGGTEAETALAENPGAAVRTPRRLPDPSRPPQRRGTWEESALVNVDVTEAIKSELRIHTPPWKR